MAVLEVQRQDRSATQNSQKEVIERKPLSVRLPACMPWMVRNSQTVGLIATVMTEKTNSSLSFSRRKVIFLFFFDLMKLAGLPKVTFKTIVSTKVGCFCLRSINSVLWNAALILSISSSPHFSVGCPLPSLCPSFLSQKLAKFNHQKSQASSYPLSTPQFY